MKLDFKFEFSELSKADLNIGETIRCITGY